MNSLKMLSSCTTWASKWRGGRMTFLAKRWDMVATYFADELANMCWRGIRQVCTHAWSSRHQCRQISHVVMSKETPNIIPMTQRCHDTMPCTEYLPSKSRPNIIESIWTSITIWLKATKRQDTMAYCLIAHDKASRDDALASSHADATAAGALERRWLSHRDVRSHAAARFRACRDDGGAWSEQKAFLMVKFQQSHWYFSGARTLSNHTSRRHYFVAMLQALRCSLLREALLLMMVGYTGRTMSGDEYAELLVNASDAWSSISTLG